MQVVPRQHADGHGRRTDGTDGMAAQCNTANMRGIRQTQAAPGTGRGTQTTTSIMKTASDSPERSGTEPGG